MTIDIEKLLGAQAKSLLDHKCTTIPKDSIHLPGPDYVERISLFLRRVSVPVSV